MSGLIYEKRHAKRGQFMTWRYVVIAFVLMLLALPIYLWRTNYCFAERRYVPRSEICAKFLSGLSSEVRTDKTWCAFEQTAMSAFLVFPAEINPRLYPQTQWGDLGGNYDSCGRRLKFH